MERCELIAAEDIKRFGFVSINSDGLAQNSIDEIFPIGTSTEYIEKDSVCTIDFSNGKISKA